MSENTSAANLAALGIPHSKDVTSLASLHHANGFPGRRISIGGMNRRSSLGMTEAALGDLFGRRSSGFGELDVLGRRASLDSTSAVLDAAIVDLTRRRLSMAMGGMQREPSFQDSFSNLGAALGGTAGMDPMSSGLGAGGIEGMNAPTIGAGAGQLSSTTGAPISSGPSTGTAPTSINSSTALSNRQQQLQEQQRDLERRQKELEIQRQKLVAAMEERRRVMQQMQQKIGQMPNSGNASTAVQRNSLLGNLGGTLGNSFGGGFGNNLGSSLGNGPSPTGFGGGVSNGLPNGLGHSLGGNLGNNGVGSGLGGGLGASSSLFLGLNGIGLPTTGVGGTNFSQTLGAPGSKWIVCKICNSKAFASYEEAAQHEAICMALDNGRRASLGAGAAARRSSLDLLIGTLERPEIMARLVNPQIKQDVIARRESLSTGFGDRRSSLLGDNIGHNQEAVSSTTGSNGPFAMMEKPLPLAMEADKEWLTPLHCFVRRHCVQIFTATEKDVQTPSKGKRMPIQVGQVGIRCPHCHHEESSKCRERGSVYYPTSISSIYNATMNLLQRHLNNCNSVPPDVMRRYRTLKADDARSGTSKKYWVESALSLGLVDTPNGIRFSALTPPPLPGISRQHITTGSLSGTRRNSNGFFSNNSNALGDLVYKPTGGNGDISLSTSVAPVDGSTSSMVNVGKGKLQPGGHGNSVGGNSTKAGSTEQTMSRSAPLVTPEDEAYATAFSFHLMCQMQPCVFTEADRLGKRKGLPPGFPGLACRHCFGGYGSGRFFPSSIKTLSDTSKTLNVLHNHMQRCRKCPPEVRERLGTLRKTHDEERAKMKFGSQKAFFARIWDRLHEKDPNVTPKRKFKAQEERAIPTGFPGAQSGILDSALQRSSVFDAALAIQQYGNIMNKRQKLV